LHLSLKLIKVKPVEKKEIPQQVETIVQNTTEFWEITVPGLPPSVNSLYANVRGRRVKSKEARKWEDLASAFIRKQVIREMEEGQKIRDYFQAFINRPIRLEIYLYKPTWHCVSKGKEKQFKKVDASNFIKAAEDVLCGSIGLDDSAVTEVVAKKLVGGPERTVFRLWIFE
jgi:Holliday junction resolvase RusA-like endonuclease